jgi:glucose/arabinose dehydrogenase
MLQPHARRTLVAVLAVAMSIGLLPVPAVDAALAPGQLTVTTVVSGLVSPVGVTHAGDGSGRLFIVQLGGTVRVVQAGKLQSATFLDITSKVLSGGERGLLGLAFHPDFETNRWLFVHYTRNDDDSAGDGDIVISRFTANPAGTSAPSGSEVVLFTIDHCAAGNHNGGSMAFGPDGYLYIGIGDGGSGQKANAQNITNRLGKILRIDVDGTGEGDNDAFDYPADNPFVGETGDDAIWAYGLRNPWRISFDRGTGDLWIGDVGERTYEEIDRQPAAQSAVQNYGWSLMEGFHCFDLPSGCDPAEEGLTLPVAEYGRTLGCSVTGGYVYRGPSQRDMQGLYVFGDYCSGRIWTIPAAGSAMTQQFDMPTQITSFGESESGELHLVTQSGVLHRVIAPEFTDIASSTFIDDIHWLVYEELTAGCSATRYCPTANVTREQMAIFLDRALDLPATTIDYFSDDTGRTGEASINRLRAAGITTGCGSTTYCPTATVTRGQMASFLVRALGLPSTTTDYFSDDAGSTHQADINRLAAAGITTGCTATTYCPSASVTRGQMAAFLRRAFEE